MVGYCAEIHSVFYENSMKNAVALILAVDVAFEKTFELVKGF